jgi:cell wall-associated NlpC family hydrolase
MSRLTRWTGVPLTAALAAVVMLSALPAAPVAAHGVSAHGVAAKPRPAAVDRQLREAWEQLEVVVEQYNDVREELKATRVKADALTVRIAPLHDAMQVRQARVGGLAAEAYRSSGVAEVSSLLAASSPEQFVQRLLVVQRLTSQQSRALGALAQARHNYETTRVALRELAIQQRAQQDGLARKKRHIQAEIRRLEKLRGFGARWTSRPEGGPDARLHDGYVPPYTPGKAGKATRFAYAQLGKGYQWGGSGPQAYDCSGLTSAAWRAAGVHLPHNSARQWNAVDPISRAELQPGDIVFYYADIHHVGLYVGDGRIIHAPSYGQRIRVESMSYAPIYGYGRP